MEARESSFWYPRGTPHGKKKEEREVDMSLTQIYPNCMAAVKVGMAGFPYGLDSSNKSRNLSPRGVPEGGSHRERMRERYRGRGEGG